MAVLSAKISLSNPGQKDQHLFDRAYEIAKRLLNKQIPKDKIRKVMTFLRYSLHFESSEISAKFVQELTVLTERTATMGIEELLLDQAKREGIAERDIQFTRNLLSSTDFTTGKIAGESLLK